MTSSSGGAEGRCLGRADVARERCRVRASAGDSLESGSAIKSVTASEDVDVASFAAAYWVADLMPLWGGRSALRRAKKEHRSGYRIDGAWKARARRGAAVGASGAMCESAAMTLRAPCTNAVLILCSGASAASGCDHQRDDAVNVAG